MGCQWANYAKGGTYHTGGSNLYDEWSRLKLDADQAEAAYKQAPGVRSRAEVAAEQAGREASRAGRKAEENQDLIDEYRRSIPELREKYDSRTKADDEIYKATNDSARQKLKGTAMGGAVAGGAEALQRLMAGKGFDLSSPNDVAELRALSQLAESLSQLDSHEKGKPETPDRTGVNFGRQAERIGAASIRDLESHGKKAVDGGVEVARRVGEQLGQLHGLQAQQLQSIARHAGDTAELARQQQWIVSELEKTHRVVQQIQAQIKSNRGNFGN